MKKNIRIFIAIIISLIIVYLGLIKKGVRYFTGIGTPYSYFQAQKAKNDSILILYIQEIEHPMAIINDDSLKLHYGFKEEFGGLEVFSSVLDLYNSIIHKELLRRLGKDKWKEYCIKLDSLQKIEWYGGEHQ
jgi:hypothetical protein